MAMIHVNRGATSLGAFPEEQVREAIRAGRFVGSDLGEPLLYGLIGGSFGYFFYLIFLLLMPSLAFMGGADKHNALAGMFGMGAGVMFGIIIIPIVLSIGIFIGAAILHVCLMIV